LELSIDHNATIGAAMTAKTVGAMLQTEMISEFVMVDNRGATAASR